MIAELTRIEQFDPYRTVPKPARDGSASQVGSVLFYNPSWPTASIQFQNPLMPPLSLSISTSPPPSLSLSLVIFPFPSPSLSMFLVCPKTVLILNGTGHQLVQPLIPVRQTLQLIY